MKDPKKPKTARKKKTPGSPTPRKRSSNAAATDQSVGGHRAVGAETQPSDPLLVEARTSYSMLVRMHQIHLVLFEQQQRDNGVRPWISSAQLAADLETTERTIGETTKRMRDDFGLPIHYVAKRRGIGYTEPVTTIPTLLYSELDSMALCFAMVGLSMIEGTPYAEVGRNAIRRLTSGMRKELAVKFEALERVISFQCTGADKHIPFSAFEVIVPALLLQQELEIDYGKPPHSPSLSPGPAKVPKPAEAAPGLRRVHPLHMSCTDFCWYLFTWDPAKKEVRKFALRRIRSVRMTGLQFPPRDFDVRKKTRYDFGAHGGGDPEVLRLRIWGHAATVISELDWQHSQKFSAVPIEQQRPDRPGEIEMTMEVAISPKVVGWILQWLGEVQIVEPASLRDDARALIKKGLADMDDPVAV